MLLHNFGWNEFDKFPWDVEAVIASTPKLEAGQLTAEKLHFVILGISRANLEKPPLAPPPGQSQFFSVFNRQPLTTELGTGFPGVLEKNYCF
jgi:hypothetical protein